MKALKLQGSQKFIIALGVVVLFAAGSTFAWVNTTWHDPDEWIANGESITAEGVGENFEYLLSLFGVQCTEHNEGKVRYMDDTLEYCLDGSWEALQN